MGSFINRDVKTLTFEGNKILSVVESIYDKVDELGVSVRSIMVYREDTDAWYGTMVYDEPEGDD